jgi:hypothetical protein
MTNNPKTRSSFFCCAMQVDQDIILSEVATLKQVPCPYQNMLDHMSGRCILSNFQPDELFFYEIVEYKDGPRQPDNEVEIERGIGSIKKSGKSFHLNRLTPLSSIDGPITRHIQFTPNKKLFIQTYIPEDYRELFSTPNTVLATEVAGCPSPVELQDYTLLGRLNGTIQSIDQQELWSILLANTRKPVEGMVRYNKRGKHFEGYDGKQWRALKWEEE